MPGGHTAACIACSDLFNAGSSPERYRRGPRPKEVGQEGNITHRYTVPTRMFLHTERQLSECFTGHERRRNNSRITGKRRKKTDLVVVEAKSVV